jgi:hypothetical protein
MLARTTLGATEIPWQDNRCAGVRWRTLSSGEVEIEGKGIVTATSREWPKAVDQWRPMILAASQKYGVPAHIIAGIMAFESAGKQNAASFCCYGLMALLPSTAALIAKKEGVPAPTKEDLLSNPGLNLSLGTRLLADLMQQYKGELPAVAVGYNAGRLRCGAGCEKQKDPDTGKYKCVGPCPANEWNWVMDCARDGRGNLNTSNYPTRVVGYANYALKNGYPLSAAPGPQPGPPEPLIVRHFWGFAILGVAVGAFIGQAVGKELDKRRATTRRRTRR